MVRGLKAKDLLKDDKVTLSTKWREKSLGNNPLSVGDWEGPDPGWEEELWQ